MGGLDARRLVFSYHALPAPGEEGPFLELTRRTPLLKRSVGTSHDPASTSAVFLELQDAAGVPLFRTLTDPFPPDVHTHGPPGVDEHDGFEVTELPAGAFTVIVPDLDDATDVVLLASGAAIARPVRDLLGWSEAQPTSELARFPFQEAVA